MQGSRTKAIIQLLIAVAITGILLRIFVLDSFIISGDSMAPTLVDGDYVFVNKMAYAFGGEPERGDIIVTRFRTKEPNVIKRVIALPRERIEILPGSVRIKEGREDDGKELDESAYRNLPNLAANLPAGQANGTTTINIDPGEYFVLGDNRFASVDSRELGAIDRWDIQGRVFAAFRLRNFNIKLY